MRKWPAVLLLSFALGFPAALFTGFRLGSTARASALEMARVDASVIEVLGPTFDEPWWSIPRFNLRTPIRTLSIRLVGERGEGRLFARGVPSEEGWVFSELYLETDDGERIDVVPDPAVAPDVR